MTRAEFDEYLEKFNSRDYDGFLDYYADGFEMIHVGGCLRGRDEVMKFYNFLHRYIKEKVIIDHFISDERMIAMEARVELECIEDLSPEMVASSDYPKLVSLKEGEKFVIPQFIHYHLTNGKFIRVECKE
jgi:hypothetical protein